MPQKASMNNNARKYNKYDEVDERILALFTENKEEAFRLLYDTYYLPLCLYSVQFTGSTETSEDIVQNLFVSFWDKNSHTAISSNLHAWLFNAVRFSSLTKVQRERYFSLDELEEESYSPIDDFYDEEELLQKRSQLLAELKKLPEQEYNVLVKIVLEDKKYNVYRISSLFFNSEPVSVRPSSVIGYNSGARTEDTYLGSYPFTFFYLESFS